MRALILVCLVAAANARFINFHNVAQPLVKRAVDDFVAHIESGPGLAEFMGVPNNAFLDSVEKATQTELGQQLSQQLSNVLAQIQSAIDHGQQVSQSLIEKAKELLKSLMAAGANVGQLAQQFLNELVQMGMLSLGNIFGKRALIGNIGNILGQISQQVQQTIQNSLSQLQGVISSLLGGSSRSDERVWNLITDSVQSIIQGLGNQFAQFQQWLGTVMQGAGTVVQGHVQNIQQLAQETLSNVNQLTSQTAQQAIDFFKPYQQDLGALWQQLQQAQQNLISG